MNTLQGKETPYYSYDFNLLQQTIESLVLESSKYNYHVHYALKANTNKEILQQIASNRLGADCVSGYEIYTAIQNNFHPQTIVFAGVGKTDEEIAFALDKCIYCFHCESLQEVQVINEIAAAKKTIANIALRINPDINADTHSHITTGTSDNKFGISDIELSTIISILPNLSNINIIGLHFHIGSQIVNLQVFKLLAERANYYLNTFFKDFDFKYVNLGGGLGISYDEPETSPIPDFKEYFSIFANSLNLKKDVQVHFEPGRSIVAQCGRLITKVLYIKENGQKTFAVVDAGMNNLIRPALYNAKHKIIHLSNNENYQYYDIVGPICETADTFLRNAYLPKIQRGDYLAILSAGAYGEVMSSNYNMRNFSEHIRISK
jgi:diaminopimelate decarboxylase